MHWGLCIAKGALNILGLLLHTLMVFLKKMCFQNATTAESAGAVAFHGHCTFGLYKKMISTHRDNFVSVATQHIIDSTHQDGYSCGHFSKMTLKTKSELWCP